jgi:hypothetical protein
MPYISVTFTVLNKGTVVRERHVENMLFMDITFTVINNGTVLRL